MPRDFMLPFDTLVDLRLIPTTTGRGYGLRMVVGPNSRMLAPQDVRALHEFLGRYLEDVGHGA